MNAEAYLVAIVAALVLFYLVVPRIIGTYLKYKGKRVVVCPETRKNVAVEVDAPRAAASALAGVPSLRLKDCTRWPERRHCGQECLAQVEIAPEDCLVRTILMRWYEGKTCALCGKPFGEIHWADHKPAVLSADGKTTAWGELPPEQIPAVLTSHSPVCWDCHVAETFRRAHPEMIIDWPAKMDADGSQRRSHHA